MPDLTTVNGRRQVVLDQLLVAGPEHFNMATWAHTSNHAGSAGSLSSVFELVANRGFDVHACGSAACLGGHAVIALHNAGFNWHQHREDLYYVSSMHRLLGFPTEEWAPTKDPEDDETDDGSMMYAKSVDAFSADVDDWPEPMAEAFYRCADSTRQVAEWVAVVQYLHHLITSKESIDA